MLAKIAGFIRSAAGLFGLYKAEPVAVNGAVAAVVAVVLGARSGHLNVGLITAAVTAVTALLARAKVSPVAK